MSGGGSSPSGNTTTVQKSDPWSAQQPSLLQGFSTANQLAFPNGQLSPIPYYPGATYAQPNAAQTGAVAAQENLGLNGSPVTNAAATSSLGILDPSFRTSNPGNAAYKDIIGGGAGMQQAIARATPGLLDTFTQGNRLNSPGAAYGVSRGIGDAAAQAQLQAASGLSQNYSQAAGQQNTAGLIAPQTQAMPYTDLANAYSAGGWQQQFQQNTINDAMQRYNYQQTAPFNMADWYNSATGGSYGGTTSLTSPYFTQQKDQLAGGLTGAASGAALGTMVAPGYGTAIGAVAGGLLGAFA
jgi:hypothetical protein